ncbi:MAG: hypothetical protein DWQ07_10145 [Chloroflexi bacterium]|nr:MAG: hypothetical protein DWQ07_10145 [Chloroflexota bacterium]MBL1192929.1 sigma-70 family RNA polymerase sigma factor [Chloroflexota bacterium]NOH10222.1 sigma-70 family RNA polymerase sigma factor [Chloroflexota bacterium]
MPMLEIALGKMTEQHIDDAHLLRLISKGDEAALVTLHERYGGQLYSYALRILKDHHVADDVLQDSLLVIWQKAGTFRKEGSVRAWLFSIVHNKAMKTFRGRASSPLDETALETIPSEFETEESKLSQERSSLLRAGLDGLSVEHRTVLELVFYQGMTMKEVAQVCNVPVGTVKSRLNYAKNGLKGSLSRAGMTMEDLE